MTYDIYAIDRLCVVDSCLKELGIESTPENLKVAATYLNEELRQDASKLGWDDKAIVSKAYHLIKVGFDLNN
ncbi:TPA: hypothetical protein NDT49_003411 [Enterobacter asburiae]|uniref:Uncharacterized protein n=1 Tax=Kluyvera ascorbata TaxID=51288 RepID=A0AB35XE17_9ENTR|nr:hypothetical protein [Shigella sonnei]HAS1416689.1 hypothetical protein [Enterobacter asburiae]HDS9658367.1 hypothetical protein [Klebsiella pneumoniae subsp. pneumoniae]HCD6061183.1 hypothetical protein [Enterobacter asburiae]HCD8882203.1 hypothetical protein [Enterobacter asburiae]HCR8506004.1 hypothetical protein [Shigella sonnei]